MGVVMPVSAQKAAVGGQVDFGWWMSMSMSLMKASRHDSYYSLTVKTTSMINTVVLLWILKEMELYLGVHGVEGFTAGSENSCYPL